MKRKRLFAIAVLCVSGLTMLASAACSKESYKGIEGDVPENVYLTKDGVYECDNFDTKNYVYIMHVVIHDHYGTYEIGVYTDYPREAAAGSFTADAWNYSKQHGIERLYPESEAYNGIYVWKPFGVSYSQWEDMAYAAKSEEEMQSYQAEDYVAVVYYEGKYPVSYAVWKYALICVPSYDEEGNFYSAFHYQYSIPIAQRQFPKINGEYQKITKRWVRKHIDALVAAYEEGTKDSPLSPPES